MATSTRLAGHTLHERGAPFSAPACNLDSCADAFGKKNVARFGGVSGPGHALCSCGWTSGHLPSGSARRQAHRDHKNDIRAAQVDTPEVPSDPLAASRPRG
jgi:hypothetical protein